MRWLKYLCNVWIGIFVYTLIFLAVGEAVTFILWVTKKLRRTDAGYGKYVLVKGIAVAALVAGFSIYGVVHAQHVYLQEYDVDIAKESPLGDGYKIALISDLHIGYSVDNELMSQMVDVINQQNPDLVVVAGDIIDNEFYAIAEPDKIAETLAGINAKDGVYGVYGNHEVAEKLVGGFTLYKPEKIEVQDDVSQMMDAANINILEDEMVTIGDMQLVGRIDGEKPNGQVLHEGEQRLSPEEWTAKLDKNKPIVFLDHEPDDLPDKAEAGVDVDLCGHTHDGQVFPGNLTINLFWDNAYGFKKFGDMNSVVSSGVGVWGPAMRVGTNSEVVIVNVNFVGK
ncbi:MAG: metallophosphoesterase [Eubacterium sp.]|nr:metallophosphoesterase [Candidatus Colimonas fimequi]